LAPVSLAVCFTWAVKAHPAVAYTLSRIALFVVALWVLYLLGARGLLLVALAALASGLISYVVLSRQRDAMSAAVSDRVRRMRERMDASAAAEDVDEDLPGGASEAERTQAPAGPGERKETLDP
jgi:Protein of unknown function (DUF4229)